jgi:hypothetical protein
MDSVGAVPEEAGPLAAELAAGPGEGEEPPPPPAHYSTGRLTRRQAQAVNGWRDRLAEDKPLPGAQRVPPGMKALGIDNRPKASCSDAVAAAAAAVLADHPDPLDVARYADASWQAHRAAGDPGRRDTATAPVYPPVSWYLPAELAAAWEELRGQAWAAVAAAQRQVAAEAAERYPATGKDGRPVPGWKDNRRRWYLDQLAARDIPLRSAQIPRGVLARLGIDAWARRGADTVCAAAAAHAAEWHEQPHRGRRDMHTLAR